MSCKIIGPTNKFYIFFIHKKFKNKILKTLDKINRTWYNIITIKIKKGKVDIIMRYKYEEIQKLKEMLDERGIPNYFCPMENWEEGYHIYYPNRENTVCSIIMFPFSYGFENGKLEIMGLLTEEEAEWDSVVGNLSAEEVFRRIVDFEKKKS